MTTLIISLPGDSHALSVKWGLEQLGESVVLITGSDFPRQLQLSFNPNSTPTISLKNSGDNLILNWPCSFWNHRRLPAVPHPEISNYDHEAIKISSEIMLEGVLKTIEENSFSVNPITSRKTYGNKISQLNLAKNCGFNIPKTIISNSYIDIFDFFENSQHCIVKPLKYMTWDCGDFDANMLTTRLKFSDLGTFHKLSFESCPMIYQEEVLKAFEYRVVVFGNQILAFKLDSQSQLESQLDWRAVSYRGLGCELVDLPINVTSCIKKFMFQSGFVSGSFDIALSTDDEYVFFEFNETGQFLWLEEICPEVPLLDIFCHFLISRDKQFEYSNSSTPIRFSDWAVNAVNAIQEDRQKRVTVNLDKRFSEF